MPDVDSGSGAVAPAETGGGLEAISTEGMALDGPKTPSSLLDKERSIATDGTGEITTGNFPPRLLLSVAPLMAPSSTTRATGVAVAVVGSIGSPAGGAWYFLADKEVERVARISRQNSPRAVVSAVKW